MRLTNEAMVDALDIFRNIVNQVLDGLRPDESLYQEVTNWLNDNIKLLNVHTIFRPDRMQDLDDAIANSSENVRTFLFDVQFRFYALAGNGKGFLDGLCTNLSEALIIDGPVRAWSNLPPVVLETMPLAFLKGSRRSGNRFIRLLQSFPYFRPVSVEEFLRNNPIIVTVLLLHLGYEEPEEPTPLES